MLPALRRLPTVQGLIEQGRYFVLHAPRQVGKTTALGALAKELNEAGRHVAVLLSMETGAPFADDLLRAEGAILDDWRMDMRSQLGAATPLPPWPDASPGSRLSAALGALSAALPRPLVVFLDEIDALSGQTLLSVLRQLRSGYRRRPQHFPAALVLCGVRDVRDYKFAGEGNERSHSASPFNIKDESLTLRAFTEAEVAELYAQHTKDTGQPFTTEATGRAFALSQGQPWLVNALARQAVEVLVPDRRTAVTAQAVDEAKELLIRRRDTHIDSLAERLREPRVRRIIEPILVGESLPMDVMNDDLLYARDLGLVTDQPQVRIANPIYQELIPRSLSYVMQSTMVAEAAWYLQPGGGLDMVLLLAAFQEFFAEHSEAWLGRFDYKEAGPHLMLMAFLQRVVNGGGSIAREFAVGSGRADLVVSFGGARSVIELKVRRGEGSEREGIAQLSRYLDRLGEPEGYLVLFDRRAGVPWSERLFIREAAGTGGQRIYVFGA